MNAKEIQEKLSSKNAENQFKKMYGDKPGVIQFQIERYNDLLERFFEHFPEFSDVSLFSAPGRTEVGGNHTDHNAGRVLAAAVDLDIVSVASPSEDDMIIVKSAGYPEIQINIHDLEKRDNELYTSASLVRGVCERIKQTGHQIGGFQACIDGQIPKGSGLSSSAAFEVMMVTILNHFYNQGKIDNTQAALIAQYSENEYFGKPCGLMDQTACAYGGMVFIDFEDFNHPVIEKIDYDFSKEGYSVIIIDTGGDHSDLNQDYADVENEMKNVAMHLGGKILREFSDSQLINNLDSLREKVNDRAILRALHFYNDDQRVVSQVNALKSQRIDEFLELIKESGESSWMLCQNCYSTLHIEEQGISIGLAATAQILKTGAWRVHGGGFAGTIQVFVPNSQLNEYLDHMRGIFGETACHEIFIRSIGTTQINF